MNSYGRFGALLGTIYVGHTHCKFLVSLAVRPMSLMKQFNNTM